MRVFDVLTVGSATQDVFLQSKHFEEVKDSYAPDGLDACIPLGSKANLDDIVFSTGGGATNAATTFAHFGLKTACVARVGKDTVGEAIIRELTSNKIVTIGMQRDPNEKTAYSLVFLADSGHRAILTYRGASAKLHQNNIPWHALRSRWIYITSLAGNLELLRRLFVFAERTNARIAWNPGNLELEHGFKKLFPFLARTNVLILNREEAAHLTETSPRHLSEIIHTLSTFPRIALAITDGGNGAYVHAEGTTYFAPALKAKRINTTGAGDAFGSAFVAGLVKGKNVQTSLQMAILNATGVISHMGAKAGILKKIPSTVSTIRVRVKTLKN